MNKKELKEILRLHELWLEHEPGGVRANLEGADLTLTDFSGANFSGAKLKGADLRFADLGGANLKGANLKVAHLEFANLKGANLECADLARADLRFANLSGTCIRKADLSDTITNNETKGLKDEQKRTERNIKTTRTLVRT